MKQESTPIKSGGHTCPWWLLFTFDNPLRKLIHNPEKILAEYVDEGDTVLDVSCGMGFFSLGLAKLVGKAGISHTTFKFHTHFLHNPLLSF